MDLLLYHDVENIKLFLDLECVWKSLFTTYLSLACNISTCTILGEFLKITYDMSILHNCLQLISIIFSR